MSREIKFRAWDGKNKSYIKLSNLRGEESVAFSGYDLGLIGPEMRDYIILEQYTGLKDKNGVEIYEGDIVKIKISTGERLASIVCEGAAFRIDLGVTTDWLDWYKEDIEVIGNIHENPELLERGKK